MIGENFNKILIRIKKETRSNRFIDFFVSKIRLLIIFVLSILASIDLKRKLKRCKEVEDYINLSMHYKYSPFKGLLFKVVLKTMQMETEIAKFMKLISSIQPKFIVEIGTARGGTLFLLTKFSNIEAHIISIDLPGGQFGGGYPYPLKFFYKSFKSKNQKLTLIRKNSHSPSTFQKLKKILKTHKLDLLFIDGDHTYKGVKKDFEMYSTLVKKNGIIAFHDIVPHLPELNCQVNKFWNEIKSKYRYEEFIESKDQKICGIGIISLNKNSLFHLNPQP